MLNGWHALLLLAFFPASLVGVELEADSEKRSSKSLEKRLDEIDAELTKLARYSLRSGVGSIGYRSISHREPGSHEWVQVTFDQAYPIDEIVLVPTLWRDSNAGFLSDGFPLGFRVLAGTDEDRDGSVITEYQDSDRLLPRIAPLTIIANQQAASWIRIEATHLSRRAFDQKFIFQLSELMVFSGKRNIALRRPVTVSSVHPPDLSRAWNKRFLVDGHLPYLMDAAQGDPSVAYISSVSRHPALTLDLGEPFPLSAIHLHAVDQSDTVPQAYPGSLGLPPSLIIEGALAPDFSDVVLMVEARLDRVTDVGPVMMWPLKQPNCRYIRIRSPNRDEQSRFGFAEIELFSQGKNVAFRKPVHPEWKAPPADTSSLRSLEALTDGRNLYGKILPVRTWVEQLSQRHLLESERPVVAAELARRYEAQKRNLFIMTWVAAILAAAIGFTILVTRFLRLRQATRMRERFAADLHDELGANIHTIGLLGDLARDTQSPDELQELLERSRVFTERSGRAIRNWANVLESRGLCEDLVDEMKRANESLLADIDHKLTFDGSEHLANLKPRRRIDIFLFYKECLVNILRHSQATHVTTHLQANLEELSLIISDNGHGIAGEVPPSLKRRARLIRGQVTAENSTEGGTCIKLHLKRSKRPLFG